MQFPSSFFSIPFVSVHVVHLYSRTGITAAWKEMRLILSDRSDFHMIDNRSIEDHAFARRILMTLSVDEMLYGGTWTGPLISDNHDLVRGYLLLDRSICTLFCLHSHGGHTSCSLGFGLARYICKKRDVICVVCIRSSLYGVSSASCFFSLKPLSFIRAFNIRST